MLNGSHDNLSMLCVSWRSSLRTMISGLPKRMRLSSRLFLTTRYVCLGCNDTSCSSSHRSSSHRSSSHPSVVIISPPYPPFYSSSRSCALLPAHALRSPSRSCAPLPFALMRSAPLPAHALSSPLMLSAPRSRALLPFALALSTLLRARALLLASALILSTSRLSAHLLSAIVSASHCGRRPYLRRLHSITYL